MLKQNPLFHAIAAAGYIILVVSGINATSNLPDGQETILAPIIMLSLLVLSVALMGYLFFAEPVFMFIQGKKEEAVSFFAKTILYFAALVVVFVALFFFLSQ